MFLALAKFSFLYVFQTGVNTGVSASYGGVSGSVGMSVDSSKLSKNSDSMFGSDELHWRVGSKQYNSPTKIKLEPISFLLDRYVWHEFSTM